MSGDTPKGEPAAVHPLLDALCGPARPNRTPGTGARFGIGHRVAGRWARQLGRGVWWAPLLEVGTLVLASAGTIALGIRLLWPGGWAWRAAGGWGTGLRLLDALLLLGLGALLGVLAFSQGTRWRRTARALGCLRRGGLDACAWSPREVAQLLEVPGAFPGGEAERTLGHLIARVAAVHSAETARAVLRHLRATPGTRYVQASRAPHPSLYGATWHPERSIEPGELRLAVALLGEAALAPRARAGEGAALAQAVHGTVQLLGDTPVTWRLLARRARAWTRAERRAVLATLLAHPDVERATRLGLLGARGAPGAEPARPRGD